MRSLKQAIAICSVFLLLFCFITNAVAADTINTSIYGNQDGSASAVTIKTNETFSVYFGADALALNDTLLNTYEFTVLYDANYVEPIDESGQNLAETTGYSLTNGKQTEKRSITDPDTQTTTEYSTYTFSFTSYEKGFPADDAVFKALASIKFRGLRTGTSKILLLNEDVLLLPVYTDTAPETLPGEVLNGVLDVTIERASTTGGNIGGVATYTVTFNVDGAKTTQKVERNTAIEKPEDPVKEGYIFEGWFTDEEFTNEFDFNTKITRAITLYAKFTAEDNEDDNPDTPVNPPTPDDEDKMDFEDVKESDWFYDGVLYAWKNDLVSGTGDNLFSPDMTLTRGTMVTLLYRIEGEPQAPACPFTDVAAGAWYEKAVAWAADKGIVLGVGENLFAPDQEITREQIAVILYNYTKLKNGDIATTGTLDIFADKEDVSNWATDSLLWAVGKGLLQGVGENRLAPADHATRAEIVTVLMRYLQNK